MITNKIIVLDGMDASGKETIKHGLISNESFITHGMTNVDFPQYNEPTGQRVREYLNTLNENDKQTHYSIYRDMLLYTQDRLHYFHRNNTGMTVDSMYPDKGIIFDRYTTANMIYQTMMAMMTLGPEYLKMAEDIYVLEHGMLGIPKPDVVIILKNHPDIISENVKKRNLDTDLLETKAYQEKVSNVIDLIDETYGHIFNWKVIDVYDKETMTMLPREDILNKVHNTIKETLLSK